MSITINSNILSLNTQRRLGEHTSSLRSSFERLSSGLRINKASDDAAGLAVSSLLDADKRVANQGVRNINDGISYLNVAESALGELTNIVTRIGELAEQSANGTLGVSQRQALQGEVTALQSEYNRIIKSTKFNGNELLTGLSTKTVLQGGYGTNGQLAVQVGDASLGIANDLTRAGLTIRVDTTSDGTVGNAPSSATLISADGRFVAFQTSSTNLAAGDVNATRDAFVKDTLTGKTSIVSSSSSGIVGAGPSTLKAISADGRFVGFDSTASNLVSGDTNALQDAFMKDMITGETIRVSTDSFGNEGNAFASIAAISADGRFVAFNSGASNLVAGDTNGLSDAFIKDTLTGKTTRVSTDNSENEGNGSSFVKAISADGRFVAFDSSSSNLIPGDGIGIDAFIKDTLTGELRMVSTDSAGNQANSFSTVSAISADGRFIAFVTAASNLVAGDTNGINDGYIKDTLTGVTSRVTTDTLGNQSDGTSDIKGISADGRFVVFESNGSNLVAGDTNGTMDAFIKDTMIGETRRISTDSAGIQGSGISRMGGISADGRFATFSDSVTGGSYLRDLSKTGIQEISGLIVSNQSSAKITLELSKKYLHELSGYKASIGASLSRATTFVNTLQIQSENYAAASSQITDVDVAEESSKLLKTQILQQAATLILSQANQQPGLALKLLQGF